MAIRRRYNFLGQQRVDVNHLKSLESAVSNDFDELLKGLVTGEGQSYVVRGFEINLTGAIGSSANGLQLLVSDSCVLHGNSDQSGTFYTINSNTPSEILNSTSNAKVEGSFTPNTDNYIAIEFVRQIDDNTIDQVYFWNPTTNIEITRTVPSGIILGYKIVITTSNFQSNTLPIAIVRTDSSNSVIEITDRRPLLFRLGQAGFNSPNPFYTYPWSDGRQENFYTSDSSVVSPFKGGDKQISDMKSFFDAMMSEIKFLKGTPYWYSETSGGSIYRARQDALNTAFTGKGTISHAISYFNGQVSGMATDVTIKATSENVTLIADNVKTIDQLISEWNVANNDQPITLIAGDGNQIPNSNIVMTSVPGRINWSSDLIFNFIGGRLKYNILPNNFENHTTLLNNQVAYINLVRGKNIAPKLIFVNTGTIVSSVGNIPWTADLQPGDFIKDASRGDEYYYEIDSVNSPFKVTLKEPFQESSAPNGIEAQYAFGVYETSASPTTDRHIFIEDRKNVPFNEDTFWLFYRQDDGGTVPKVYVRMLGGQELEQGEERQISDNTSLALLNYVGSTSEQDSDPNYTIATGSAKTNIHLTDGENLTRGIKRLEHRDDIIPRVRVIDLISTVLPTGSSVVIDGETLNNDDYVMFVQSGIEGLYKVSGVGVSVAFEKMPMFKGVDTPVNGDLIRVSSGTDYLKTIWKRVAGYWKPLEVKDATKEPTGFPNRTDSQISFNNITRKLSISPLAPSDHFDIFVKGRIFRKTTAQEIEIPDSEGLYFFFFETNGTLNYSTVFDVSIITTRVFTATLYWDADNKEAILIGDERHGITMDGATHEYLHNTNGAVVTFGGTIGFQPYIDGVSGGADADAQISLTNIVLRDEDIRMDITHSATPSNPFEQILDTVAEIPVYYRDGASGNWRKESATQYPIKAGGTSIQWNNPTGPWTQEDITDGYHVSMWIFATNNIDEPVIAILGQKEHELLSDAQEQDVYDSLSFGQMPTQEFKVLYRLIFKGDSSFANAPKAALSDVRDLRSSQDTQFAQASPNDHGLLSGLNDPDHGPTAVTTAGITKDGGLSESDVDVKQSLDTLNKLLGQLVIAEHPSNKKRVTITGVDRVLNNSKFLSKTIEGYLIDFDGAEIDFETGNIFKSDGVTPLGVNFVPANIPTDNYIYYSVTLIATLVNANNEMSCEISIKQASTSNTVKNDAPKAIFDLGLHIGQVVVRKDVSGIYNISQEDIVQSTNSQPKNIPLQNKGDILVNNGQENVSLSVGNPGQILIADPTVETGIRWEDNAGEGALGLDEDGNLNVELKIIVNNDLVLTSPNFTNYRVFVSDGGVLSTQQTVDTSTSKFKITKPDNSFAEIKVNDDGSLFVQSPVDSTSVITNDSYYLKSYSGISWKFTVNNQNILIMTTVDNSFSVKSELGDTHLSVQQINPNIAFTGIQTVPENYFSDMDMDDIDIITNTLSSEPLLCFLVARKVNDNYNQLMVYQNNSITYFSGHMIGDIKISALSLSDFQKFHDTTWILANGQLAVNTEYEILTGESAVPTLNPGVGLYAYIKVN